MGREEVQGKISYNSNSVVLKGGGCNRGGVHQLRGKAIGTTLPPHLTQKRKKKRFSFIFWGDAVCACCFCNLATVAVL